MEQRWRRATFVVLGLLVLQTWLAVDTAVALKKSNEQVMELGDELQLYMRQSYNEATARDTAEHELQLCRGE